MSRRRHGPCSWFALLATLGSLLSPAATLAQNQAITLQGVGGDAWTFEKDLKGELPDGGCDRVPVASPRATVEAWQADRWGNLTYRLSGRNFNPIMATAAKLTIAQTQHFVELGELDPETIVTPGIYVDRIIHVPYGDPPPAMANPD